MSKRSQPDHPETNHPTTKRAKEIDAHPPYEELTSLLDGQESPEKTKRVLHWFRSKDLRIHDNRALHAAAQFAKESKAPLLCTYLNCPAEFSWHGTSPARTDFICENLALMQSELKKLDIPLVFLEASERDDIVPTIVKFIRDNNISHVFANYEYEVDELRRDVRFIKQIGADKTVKVTMHHDQTVKEPGTLLNESGKPMKVFTPYHRSWLAQIKADPSLFDTVPAPSKNSPQAQKDLKSYFNSKPPSPPAEKQFASEEERKRIRDLWPAGHDAAVKRLNHFLTEKIEDYANTRSNPAKDSTSRMSAYFAAGVISMRETLRAVSKANKSSADFSQNGAGFGIASWVRELVFRELYRQTTLTTPHTAMNLPQNLKFDFVHWEEDEEGYDRWEKGTLGIPFVDAGMRQIAHEAYMHNRLRMNVSSYLYCNLLIDYRRGERYFAETLIDWDLNNNTQGWEPSYTVFNPITQAEKNDPEGEYIRKWIPELKDVKGKAVFDPYHRLSTEEFEKLGYPKPYVDWKTTKQRAIERFKSDMKDAEP
ncbi:deoxyribodipyrimidine photo-lyase [Exophiala viscosa]|uniref:deoxyribodipyrimidine photo-lyase n=1 Tax=Exophiala viscosa TaxID=2486360 RepID=UPI0021900B02|nr:deoxyribodipyrimidine photo-lyase [Exophiala viscosa]